MKSNLVLQITTVDEAKQFYPLFGLGANVALIFSGRAVKYFSQVWKLKLFKEPRKHTLSLGTMAVKSTHLENPQHMRRINFDKL